MKTSFTFAAFAMVSALAASAALASEGTLHISINTSPGSTVEHISNVSLSINKVTVPAGSPANTADNDAQGMLSYDAPFDHDQNTRFVLSVDNHATGHKVRAGHTLRFIDANGTSMLVGTTVGEPFNEGMFAYDEKIQLAAGVSVTSQVISTSAPIKNYFRNALNVCMRQDYVTQTSQAVFAIDSQKFTKTSVANLTVGPERIAPFKCK